jgi:hypothetical protein
MIFTIQTAPGINPWVGLDDKPGRTSRGEYYKSIFSEHEPNLNLETRLSAPGLRSEILI